MNQTKHTETVYLSHHEYMDIEGIRTCIGYYVNADRKEVGSKYYEPGNTPLSEIRRSALDNQDLRIV